MPEDTTRSNERLGENPPGPSRIATPSDKTYMKSSYGFVG